MKIAPLIARIVIIAALASLIPKFAKAEEMTTGDNVREGVFAGLIVLDYLQSTDIKHHDGMYELNPIVVKISGKNPSDLEFGAWCVGTVVLHYAVSKLLTGEVRHAFQYVTIGVEGANVGRNFHIGLRVAY